ncbi:flagellar hook-length control protein FliK [Hyphococcus sp.]|uniref:flagellar hook-length control protein FliK n=1 Tax=Hyphococcus sp. TaxID=2038636 RepID=UPI00208B149F|nr:MAG: hypothetical protein DHS20C04_24850 [Marinicaulis sp.]
MENTQFPIVNAIFSGKFVGGKFADDALANGKTSPQSEAAAKDADGFFTFIEGLLKPATETDDDSGAPLLGAIVSGQQPITPLEESTIGDALEGKPPTPETNPAPQIGKHKIPFGPNTDPVTSPNVALALDLPPGDPATTADMLSEEAALAVLGEDAGIKQNKALLAQTTVAQAAEHIIPGAANAAPRNNVVQEAPLSDQPAEPIEIKLEGRGSEGPSRFDAPTVKTHIDSPNLVLPQQANPSIAIAEHAAPEALIHSAVTRDEVAALDADRFAASRLEMVTHAADRNAHLNPVRDQIVAAVASRHGDSKLEIRLDPPELGKVLIGFERDGTDIVRAVVSADSPQTLDLMRRHADVFQRALEAQGFENLDLHFADKGPGENGGDLADQSFKNFRLADETGQADDASSAPHLVDGRLDRRL